MEVKKTGSESMRDCVCVSETKYHSEALAGTHYVAQDGLEPHGPG